MLQVTLTTPEHLEFRQVDKPSPAKDEILLKIKRIGICGSDIHAYYGKHPTVFLPIIQGHEFSAEVAELGSDVSNFNIGERVTVRPQLVCKTCYHCQHGHENICHKLKVIGCQVPGAAQEYLAVKQEIVVKIPQDFSFDDAAMIEPVAVGVAAVRSFTTDVKGKNVLVLGAGTIGNMTAQVAKAMGANSVVITDLSAKKLEVAKQCNIDFVVNTRREDLAKVLENAYGPDGLDCALECVGIEATINQAIKVCRKKTEIIVVGVYGKPPLLDMINVQEKELRLIGTLMYLEQDYKIAIDLIRDKKIHLDPLKTKHFPLSEYDKAYLYIEQHTDSSMKVLIDVAD
jgi:L-iditol 2-dehydrogenase